jgi:hypothetical protein
MPASQFDPSLELLPGFGPHGKGPVEPGRKVLAMQVWFFQRRLNGAAFASGSRDDTGPFEERWVIPTKLELGSDEFAVNEPAAAMALAIVQHPDGSKDVEQWWQSVTLTAP